MKTTIFAFIVSLASIAQAYEPPAPAQNPTCRCSPCVCGVKCSCSPLVRSYTVNHYRIDRGLYDYTARTTNQFFFGLRTMLGAGIRSVHVPVERYHVTPGRWAYQPGHVQKLPPMSMRPIPRRYW